MNEVNKLDNWELLDQWERLDDEDYNEECCIDFLEPYGDSIKDISYKLRIQNKNLTASRTIGNVIFQSDLLDRFNEALAIGNEELIYDVLWKAVSSIESGGLETYLIRFERFHKPLYLCFRELEKVCFMFGLELTETESNNINSSMFHDWLRIHNASAIRAHKNNSV